MGAGRKHGPAPRPRGPLDGDRAEHRANPAGVADTIAFPAGRVSRSTLQPGWRWSEHVGRAMGLALCPAPHLGYVTRDEYEVQFTDIFDQIISYAAGNPTNVVNPQVLQSARLRR